MQREVAEVKAVRAFTRIILPFSSSFSFTAVVPGGGAAAACLRARVQLVSESIKFALPTNGMRVKEDLSLPRFQHDKSRVSGKLNVSVF